MVGFFPLVSLISFNFSSSQLLQKEFRFTLSMFVERGHRRYIDAWSLRTTWGGGPPPSGCGDYVVDKDCTDSVVIPQGQTVLLDISPPRLYLLLVEGTLIFDRRDIELKVTGVY